MKDMVGRVFGRLTVISRTRGQHGSGAIRWLCRCICGHEKTIAGINLRSGKTVSCGCFKKEMLRDKNRSRVPLGTVDFRNQYLSEWQSWRAMKMRCQCRHGKMWRTYGSRGIDVCQRWKNNFRQFLIDMGTRPANTTLNRINNDEGYNPENCEWATSGTQSRNRRTNVMITYDGRTMCRWDWSKETGIQNSTLARRLDTGWSVKRALTTRPSPRHDKTAWSD